MAEPSNREIVDRYLAGVSGDHQTLGEFRHKDFVEDWPQTGERIRVAENMAQIDAHYPGGMPTGGVERVVGSEDRWVMTPSFTLLHVSGSGDVYTALLRARDADSSDWWIASFMEVRTRRSSGSRRCSHRRWTRRRGAEWVEPILDAR